MKSLRMFVVSAGLLAAGLVTNAHAQTRGYYDPRDDPYYRTDRYPGGYADGGYNRDGGRYYDRSYGRTGSPVRQALSDLDRVASNTRLDHHEIKHVDEAARKLQEFEERWARGHFDNGKLDRAIENIQHLAEADQVRPRDRDILGRDLAELRQFRATRGYSNGGYGNDRFGRYDRGYNPRWP